MDMYFQPTPGFNIQERAVVVRGGREIRSIMVLPASTNGTATHIKM